MITTVLRVIFGFIAACVVCGLVQTLFVITPSEISSLPAEQRTPRIDQVGLLSLLAGTHSAIFAAPFALILTGIAEWFRVRSIAYYIAAGMVIALLGFYAQYASEVAGQPTVMNNYALGAFLASGLAGGLTYWLTSGRYAGRHGELKAASAAALAQQPLLVESPPPLETDVVTITKPGGQRAKSKTDDPVAQDDPDDDDNNASTVTRFERDQSKPKLDS
jgi:hypothetical protein